MNIEELRVVLNDRRVIEEINKHLWIESQKAGQSIGLERARDEWLRLYAEDWIKYNMPERYAQKKRNGQRNKEKAVKHKAAKRAQSNQSRK